MKIKTLLTTALIAVGVGWGLTSARAALTYSAGDLFLGFRQDGSKSYLINLGSISQFTARNGAAVSVVTGGNIVLDLNSTAGFGANWSTDGSVSWGAIGTTYDGGANVVPTIFATRARATPSVQSDPWIARSTSGQNATVTTIQGLGLQYARDGVATANSTRATFQNSGSNTWLANTNPELAGDFGAFPDIEGSFSSLTGGAPGSILDLYQVNPGSGREAEYLGYFSITNLGAITFTAVPEPGTVALLALAGVFLVMRLRRRATHS